MTLLARVRRGLPKGQAGFSLLETLVAVAILAAIGVAFVNGLMMVSKGTGMHQRRATASSLAQSQVEYVKTTEYLAGGEYAIGVEPPPRYTLTSDTVQQDVGRQEVTVRVYHQDKLVLKMETLKVDW